MGSEGRGAKLTLQGLPGRERSAARPPAHSSQGLRLGQASPGREVGSGLLFGWAAGSAVEDLHEGLAELNVEGRVDDGVHGTVDIAQPREGAVQDRWDVAITVNVQDVCDKEGQPADDEHAWGRGRRSGWPQGQRGAELEGPVLSGPLDRGCRPQPRPWDMHLHPDWCPSHPPTLPNLGPPAWVGPLVSRHCVHAMLHRHPGSVWGWRGA